MQVLSQRLTQNTLALLVSNAGSAILSFLLSVLIGRLLGESNLGVYASALAWIFPLSLMTEFGLGTLITRDIAQNPDDAHAYLRVSLIVRLIIGSLLIGIIWILAPYLTSDPFVVNGLRVSSPMIIILPFYSSFTAILRAYQIMKPIAFFNLGMLVSQVILTVIVLTYDGSILAVLAINTITSAGQLIAIGLWYRWHLYQPTKTSIAIMPLLRLSLPFAIAAILAAVQSRIVIIMLEQFTSTSNVGLYSAASRFIEAGRMIPHAFFDALFPLLAGLASNPAHLAHVFRRVLLGLVAYGIIFGIIISVIATPLIMTTYGASFEQAIPILSILAWSLLPMLLKSGQTLYWYAQGQEQFVNFVNAVVIVIQIGIVIWTIPNFGVIGAVWSVILTEIIATILLFLKRN